jgi:hypothetical protein
MPQQQDDAHAGATAQGCADIAVHVIQTGEAQLKARNIRARREAKQARVLDVLTDRNLLRS